MLPAGAWAAGSDLEHCADAPGVLGISALLVRDVPASPRPAAPSQLLPTCDPKAPGAWQIRPTS